MAARENDETSGGRYEPRRPVYRTLQPLMPGEPPPGTGVVRQEMVKPFSYEAPRYQAPRGSQRAYQVPNAPDFYVPPFLLPRGEDVFNDPSYQFRLNEGLKALERSAAARGTLRTGNTLEDLMRYGQDYASTEYGKAVDRARGQYETNLNVSQLGYAPRFATWQARNEAEQLARQQAEQRAWQEYQFRIDDEFRREQMLLNAQRGL